MTQHTTLSRERRALTLLRLRGPDGRQSADKPPLDAGLYDTAAGILKAIARETGETPDALLRRLHITGYRRARLMAYQSKRWRLTKKEREDHQQYKGSWRFPKDRHL